MSSSQQVPAKKQQDLQTTYSNFKNTLQQIASKIGDIEQEAEEHKCVFPFHLLSFHLFPSPILVLHVTTFGPRAFSPGLTSALFMAPIITPHCSPTYRYHTADLITILGWFLKPWSRLQKIESVSV
ncbi:prefoldin subunit 2 [Trichoderma gamsii]|uniref:Prefoldin subunit 2 n=1 Tax=Trichoderma gamsii TaxID=398673 RepID=A0A2P4Z9Q8_9HYPO|nr:prefoldin subunit 2 [Trichoderma gamsii]PON20992.1 prefoldin subunit 2 [Trichoderma gamsii]